MNQGGQERGGKKKGERSGKEKRSNSDKVRTGQ